MLVGPSNCGGEPFALNLDAGPATLNFFQMVSSARDSAGRSNTGGA